VTVRIFEFSLRALHLWSLKQSPRIDVKISKMFRSPERYFDSKRRQLDLVLNYRCFGRIVGSGIIKAGLYIER
jgi:hypothetical protein